MSLQSGFTRKMDFLVRAFRYWEIYGTREFLRLSFAYIRSWLAPPDTALQPDHRVIGRVGVLARATPGPLLFARPLVVLIGDLSLYQCEKYRVLQKVAVYRQLGISATHHDWRDAREVMESLQCATYAVFYRVPSDRFFTRYVDECRRLGLPTLYDVDDPVFSYRVYAKNSNLGHLRPFENDALLQGCRLFLDAIQRCDLVIGSTPQICALLQRETGRSAHLWPNLLDDATLSAAKAALSVRPPASAAPTLGYASGSRAHEADFRTITSVLASLMARHPTLELHILGHLRLPTELSRYSGRIVRREFTEYHRYMDHLARVDVHIVPLTPDAFNESKSAIRFLEASALGIPTVAAPIGDFANIIEHGVSGLLASTPDVWAECLTRLIVDPAHRRAIGENARALVLRRYRTLPEQFLERIAPEALRIANVRQAPDAARD